MLQDICTHYTLFIGFLLGILIFQSWKDCIITCKIVGFTAILVSLKFLYFFSTGELSREQLSLLLFAYLVMATDIIELFECFKEEIVTRKTELIYATLCKSFFKFQLYEIIHLEKNVNRYDYHHHSN